MRPLLENIPPSKRQEVIDRFCLTYPTWFCELLTEVEGKPFVLQQYQIAYLLDESRFKATNKTRQAGASLSLAAAKFWKAYTNEFYRCDIVSVNRDEARDKITKIRAFYDSLPRRWKHPLHTNNHFSIGFHADGRHSMVNSIAASSGIRGGKKDVIFDEGAHIINFAELYVAALPATIHGEGGLDVTSTPLGMTGRYYEIYENIDNNYPEFNRHFFGWWDATFFCKDIEEANKRWTVDYEKSWARMPELVEEFGTDVLLPFFRQLTTEEFHQEFCGRFVDESTAYFPWDLIKRCQKYDHAQPKPNGELDHFNVLEPWDARPKGNDNVVLMGIDFAEGRKGGDETSIQILEKGKDGILRLRKSVDLSGEEWTDFDRQLRFIGKLIDDFRPSQVRIDETGLGRKLAQDLRKAHGSIIDPITFTNANKEEMALNLKGLMEKQNIWLPYKNSRLAGQIHNLKRTYAGTVIRYSGEPHDDMFWALALAARGENRMRFQIITIDEPTIVPDATVGTNSILPFRGIGGAGLRL